MSEASLFKDVEALVFDVFGTVVDWYGSVIREMTNRSLSSSSEELKQFTEKDWADFVVEWRKGYYSLTRQISEGMDGPRNADILHRQILNSMLEKDKWSVLKRVFNEKELQDINMIWHHLDGWADSSKGIANLRKKFVVSTLTNGNVRLMADMAKHADLHWDVILSSEMMGTYKPNPAVYNGALHYLSVKPEQCAMVAAHIYDLRAAAKQGLRTVYVRRETEDSAEDRASVKSKKEGGEVDIVVDSLEELAILLGCV